MYYDEMTSATECRLIIAVADIAGFAQVAQAMSSREIFDTLNEFYELVGGIVEDAGGKVIKFMGDAALIVFPEDTPNQAIEGLRSLKIKGEDWLSGLELNAQIQLKAHIGSVICGSLGTTNEKRFDIIGGPVNELFMMRSGEFVLSPELEQVLTREE